MIGLQFAGTLIALVFALSSASQPVAAQNGDGAAPLPSGREIVDRHVEAIGGRAALLRLESREVWASFEIPGERLRGTIEVFAARPNKRVLRVSQRDAGTTVTGFDGVTAWKKEPGKQAVALRGRELAQVRDDAVYDFDLHDDPDVTALQSLGPTKWEGRECHRVRVRSRSGREWVEFYDVVTGLFSGSESRRETDKGQVTVKTVVSGYKAYDGVRLPSMLSLRSGGVEQVIRIIRVRHNAVSQAAFTPPPGVGRAAEGDRP